MSTFRQLVIRHVLALNAPVFKQTTRSIASSTVRAAQSQNQNIFDGWHTIIGLEIHAQLKAEEKLFSRAPTSFISASRGRDEKAAAEPGSNIEPLDAAFPGTLPVLNPEAVDLALRVSLALQCEVNPRSTFDRKHYFYHDLPTGYQITQKYNPLARNGVLHMSPTEDAALGREVSVRISQVQMEQDTAKSFKATGDGQFTVDLNRAGVGLVEIVTEADMRSPEEAAAFARKLQSVLRRIGACDGDMDKGNFRIDANVSVHREGEAWGTRCEIKNLNSIRSMQLALDFEKRRHIAHYTAVGPKVPLKQETRGINEETGETFALRSKEEAEDYRYMPEPNVPAVVVTEGYLRRLRADLPELPSDTASRLQDVYGISSVDAYTLIGLDEQHGLGVKYFEEVAERHAGDGKKVANWVNHELLGQLSKREEAWTPLRIPAGLMSDLIQAVTTGEITGTSGKSLVKAILARSSDSSKTLPRLPVLLDELGLRSMPADALEGMCKAAIEKLPREAESVRKGKVKVIMRLVGEVMQQSKGRADAVKAKAVLERLLGI